MDILQYYRNKHSILQCTSDHTILNCWDNCSVFPEIDIKLGEDNILDTIPWSMDSKKLLQRELDQLHLDGSAIEGLNLLIEHHSESLPVELSAIKPILESDHVEISIKKVEQVSKNSPSILSDKSRLFFIQNLGGIGTAEIFFQRKNPEDFTFVGDTIWEEILGVDTSEMNLSKYLTYIDPSFHHLMYSDLERVQKGADSFGSSHTFNNPYKGEIWVEVHGRVLQRDEKEVKCLLMIQDITLERERVKALKEYKDKLEKATELAKVGYFEVDLTSGSVYWDPICYQLHGYPENMEINYEYFVQKVVHPADIVNCINFFQEQLALLKPFIMEYRSLDSNGDIRWIKEKIEPIVDENSLAVTQLKGAKLDITDQKKHEEILENYRKELEIHNKSLQEMVIHDELTKIYNRKMFNERYEYEWHRAVRDGGTLTIAIADIDHFKEFNDSYGHISGDICLTAVADCLNKNLTRSTDIVARYGGEEFAFILPNTSEPEVLLERCREKIQELAIQHMNSVEEVVTISIGCATMAPQKGETKEPLLKKADEELYKAKSQGRNKVCSYAAKH